MRFDDRVYHGHEGYRRAWETADEVWEDFKLLPEEVIDFGDRLVTAARYTGQVGTSGVPINQPVFQVSVLRRGLVFRQEDFTDRNKALEAAGLSE